MAKNLLSLCKKEMTMYSSMMSKTANTARNHLRTYLFSFQPAPSFLECVRACLKGHLFIPIGSSQFPRQVQSDTLQCRDQFCCKSRFPLLPSRYCLSGKYKFCWFIAVGASKAASMPLRNQSGAFVPYASRFPCCTDQ